MNGFINLYKESSYTSHDCVAKLRGILKQKKIGHMGTLDPDACGVLPVALGKATRLIELFSDDRKTYRVRLQLGTVTDTLDTFGTVLETREVTVSAEETESCVLSFLGSQKQIPPMYSALKKDGKKLYELARAGIEIEREPRQVTFFDIFDLQIDLPFAEFTVTCSKGTYIRSLCDDIGRKLGCGGCMAHLERLAVGCFIKASSHTLADVREYADTNRLNEIILPMTAMFPDLMIRPCFSTSDVLAHNGNPIEASGISDADLITGRFWLIDSAGNDVGVYERKGRKFYPVKMVYEHALL